MKRKKWTPEVEITEEVVSLRERKKWQIALRRYIIDGNPSVNYAPYFGLDIKSFKNYIEIQFNQDQFWNTFNQNWQLDHIVPVSYFDLNSEQDLQLCWNFINIKVADLNNRKQHGDQRIDILAARAYFEAIFNSSGYIRSQKMMDKLTQLESSRLKNNNSIISHIGSRSEYLKHLSLFDSYDFNKLNQGESLVDILDEKQSLSRLSGA